MSLTSTEPKAVSIHAPREGCDYETLGVKKPEDFVSIHAPREGCDLEDLVNLLTEAVVSIHAPREGCDIIVDFLIRQ